MDRLIASLLALLACMTPAFAQQVGQFQIVPLPKGNAGCCDQDALVIDTVNGHVWEWQRTPTGKGNEITVLQYQGQTDLNRNFINGKAAPPWR
jgi:hypothetical protein